MEVNRGRGAPTPDTIPAGNHSRMGFGTPDRRTHAEMRFGTSDPARVESLDDVMRSVLAIVTEIRDMLRQPSLPLTPPTVGEDIDLIR